MKTSDGNLVHCPKCGSVHIRYSERRTFCDRLVSPFKLFALRCRSCRRRFYAKAISE